MDILIEVSRDGYCYWNWIWHPACPILQLLVRDPLRFVDYLKLQVDCHCSKVLFVDIQSKAAQRTFCDIFASVEI
jgi:hypothetical protein